MCAMDRLRHDETPQRPACHFRSSPALPIIVSCSVVGRIRVLMWGIAASAQAMRAKTPSFQGFCHCFAKGSKTRLPHQQTDASCRASPAGRTCSPAARAGVADRKSVVQGKSVSERVEHEGVRRIKKKRKKKKKKV